jgi:molybdopterin converting factor small subunit
VAVLHLRQPLRRLAGNEAEHRVGAATVMGALRELEEGQPGLRGWILDERGAVRRHINVYVNGERAGEDSPLGSDDRVDVLPAISGG